MAQVTVTVNGRNYTIACDDGQEAHLHRLGRYMDKRSKELTAAVGHVNEGLLLVMVGLLVSDELSDAYGEIEALRGSKAGRDLRGEAEEAMAVKIETLAERIESLAETLGKA